MSWFMCIGEIIKTVAVTGHIHEKWFNSPNISKSDSFCRHINLPTSTGQCCVLIGRAVWGEYNHLHIRQLKKHTVCLLTTYVDSYVAECVTLEGFVFKINKPGDNGRKCMGVNGAKKA